MVKALVIDVGRARVKWSLWRDAGDSAPVREGAGSIELGGLSEVDLAPLLVGLADVAKADGAAVVVVGGSRFRAARGLQELLRRSLSVFEPVILSLSGEGEARALSVSAGVSPGELLLDIGGGSVQMIDPGDASRVASWPIGTFALEEEFGLSHGAAPSLYESVARQVSGMIALSVPQADHLVVGSNIMLDFFEALSTATGAEHPFRPQDLPQLLSSCRRLDPVEFPVWFPQNPNFMYGAAALLTVTIGFARVAEPKSIVGTNASVSAGVARAFFSNGLGALRGWSE